MTSPLDQSLSKLNLNTNEDHKIRLKHIKNQFQQGKSVFKGYQTFCKKYGYDEMKYKDFDFWWYRFKNGQNDLDYDRSKDPETHEFSDFPIEVVKKIVEKSGCKERLILRNVSKGLRDIVDNSKHFIEYINLHGIMTSVSLSVNNEYIHRDWKQSLNSLKTVLNWPNMKVEELTIRFEGEINQIVEETKKIFISLNHQISANDVHLHFSNIDTFLAVLSKFKPGILQDINVSKFFNENYLNLENIINLDQWKEAKLVTAVHVKCPIESLFHLEYFVIDIQKLSVDDFVKLKNALLISEKFTSGAMKIDDHRNFEILRNRFGDKLIPIPKTNQLLEIEFDPIGTHIFRFRKRSA